MLDTIVGGRIRYEQRMNGDRPHWLSPYWSKGLAMQDYNAFVSSTAKDLLPHRAHVIQELRRAGFQVDPMEDWPASTDEPKKFSQERLDGCLRHSRFVFLH